MSYIRAGPGSGELKGYSRQSDTVVTRPLDATGTISINHYITYAERRHGVLVLLSVG